MKRTTFALLGLVLFVIACGPSDEGPRIEGGDDPPVASGGVSSEGACAFQGTFEGRVYVAHGVRVDPPEGPPVGDFVMPPCNDTNDSEDETSERIAVVRLPGVSPRKALVIPGRWDVVLVREGLDRLPDKVLELTRTPGCDAEEGSIQMRGSWLGILGADGKTEVDMEPPYNVNLLVETSTPDAYQGAEVRIRVPAGLGRPLTRADIKASLWEGGDLAAEVHCENGRFVADELAAYPPNG